MKRPALAVAVLLACGLVCRVAQAERTVEKLVYVDGTKSHLMDGDPLLGSKYLGANFKRDKVLPYLLNDGWRIRSVHVNEKSNARDMYGYVVIETTIAEGK